jgi:hypothetical protein
MPEKILTSFTGFLSDTKPFLALTSSRSRLYHYCARGKIGEGKMKRGFFFSFIALTFMGILYAQVQIRKQVLPKKEDIRSLKVISPNRGEKWEIGTEYPIRWESQGVFNPNMVTIILTGGGQTHMITSRTGTANDGSHNWRPRWNNPPPGHYKLQITSADGAVKDESDGSFEIVPPAVDLKCSFRTQIKHEGGTTKKPFWYVTIVVYNKGTKNLNNVLFNWVITRDNVVVEQNGAGYGLMYPGKLYETTVKQLISPGRWRFEAYVDPDNRQGENEYLRGDNTASTETQRGR